MHHRTGPRLAALAAAAFLALAAPLASAQEHEHGAASHAKVAIAHDGPASGRATVGGLAGFAVLDLGDDAVPDFHQQNRIRVTLEGVVLFETTPDSGHDYDGVNTFSLAFPAPGRYAVEALDEAGASLARFEGDVVAPNGPVAATLAADVPAATAALTPTRMAFRLQGPDGALLPHTDAIVEVRQGSDLLWRTHLHTHAAPMEAAYAFPAPGAYTVRAIGYQAHPDGTSPEFAPVTAEQTVQVSPGLPTPLLPPEAPLDQAMNLVVTGTGSSPAYAILGTYDPFTTVGPQTQQRLAVLVLDGRQAVQHVDFTARLTGPLGTVWESTTLHEYDGILETVARQAVPGTYRLAVTASHERWKGSIELPYTVAPAGALGGGPQVYGLDAPALAAGKPAQLAFQARDPAGNPFQHSELDLAASRDGSPVLLAKLHTHEDGLFPFTAAFAQGPLDVLVAPSVLDPSAAHSFHGRALGGSLDFPLQVAAGPGFPAPAAPAPAGEDGVQQAPALPLLALLAVLAVAATRRRQG